MRKLLLFVAVLALITSSLAQSRPAAIGPSAVWQFPASFLSAAHAACDQSGDPRKVGDCFVGQMAKAGAPADAVSFTRRLYKQNRGEFGIMSGFNKVGPADIAWVTYPLRANPKYGLLLVNGQPEIVNAEDLKLLDQKGMEQSFQYQDVRNQFPKVGLWPGDRDGTTWPNSQSGPNGGVQFVLGYPLRNGCQTCANAGSALFTWNFDAAGKFTGTTFMGLTPAPLTPPSSGAPQQ